MSQEKVYPPPPGFAARALINAATYESMYRDSVQNTEAFWAKQARERLDLDQALHAGEGHELRRERPARPLVRGRPTERVGELPRSSSHEARGSNRDPVGARRPERTAPHVELPGAARARVPGRERVEAARRAEGRPRHDLHADDSADGHRDAGLRADRRSALRGVRRLLARSAEGPHRGLRLEGRDHGRRRRARRQEDSAEGQRRRGDRRAQRHEGRRRRRRAAHGRQDQLGGGPRPLVLRLEERGIARVPARADERGGSAVHSLHLGLHG